MDALLIGLRSAVIILYAVSFLVVLGHRRQQDTLGRLRLWCWLSLSCSAAFLGGPAHLSLLGAIHIPPTFAKALSTAGAIALILAVNLAQAGWMVQAGRSRRDIWLLMGANGLVVAGCMLAIAL